MLKNTKRFYKVFLVEDEIVIRQGIRDRIDWHAAGFEFCGEAPDGEVALPMIQAVRPDILITDIKMPFMNGLELCTVIRERLPEIKTIILSGHDEFAYAQQALRLGVTEYLLKPISAQELLEVLQKIAGQIEKETAEKEHLHGLQQQIEGNLTMLRERFLLQLVLGGISSMEALEKSLQLKLNLIARCYLVILFKLEFSGSQTGPRDYAHYQQVEQILTALINRDSDVISFRKGLEETVAILKGDSFAHLEQDSDFLMEAVQQAVQESAGAPNTEPFHLIMGRSQPCERIGDIPRAFFQALEAARLSAGEARPASGAPMPVELFKLDSEAVEKFLRQGRKADFDAFFQAYLRAYLDPARGSTPVNRIFIEYISMDLLITAANFINELGGDAGRVLPELERCEEIITQTRTLEQMGELIRTVLTRAVDFREQRTGSVHSNLIARARAYIDTHFDHPEISLSEVAAQINLSPSHFSVVFSRETGETFMEYITRKRIDRAMELLCTTTLRTAEISEQAGYDNPHYFSTVFKKITGLSPTEFRAQAHKLRPD